MGDTQTPVTADRGDGERPPELVALRPALAMVGGLSESTIRRLIAEDRFPRPVVLSKTKSGRPCRIAFVRSELTAWVASTIARARAEHRSVESAA